MYKHKFCDKNDIDKNSIHKIFWYTYYTVTLDALFYTHEIETIQNYLLTDLVQNV